MDGLPFVYPFVSGRTFGFYHFLVIMSNAGVDIRVCVFICFCVAVFSLLLGIRLGVELLGHMVTLCLTF